MLRLAGCVILDGSGKILLLHRNKNGLVQWELPGGKIDEGENETKTAVREIQEELQVAVEIERQLGAAEFKAPDMVCHYTWFLARIVGGGQPKNRRTTDIRRHGLFFCRRAEWSAIILEYDELTQRNPSWEL